jgi:TPR repeat protein
LREEEDRHAAVQVAAHAEPLTLLAVFKLLYGMLVWTQLCSPQGVVLFSFVRLPPRLPRPFAGAPVYDMSLTHAERLCAVGCGLKGKLVRLLSMIVGHHFEPQRNWGACHKMMQSIVRRVAAGLAAAVRDKVAKEAEELCASGQCAAAVVPLQRAIYLGDSPSRALMAWLHIDGREGVAQDHDRAFELAEEGARLGCHHCQGVLSCYWSDGWLGGKGHEARSLELARESSGRGSRYGQYALGRMHRYNRGGLAYDDAQAAVFYRLAAAQGLDAAQAELGYMFLNGIEVALNHAEGLQWFQRAAAQGHPEGLFRVALCHQKGWGVRKSEAAAIRWYKRAAAAGDTSAAGMWQLLRQRRLTRC